jgi:hypothetical protein
VTDCLKLPWPRASFRGGSDLTKIAPTCASLDHSQQRGVGIRTPQSRQPSPFVRTYRTLIASCHANLLSAAGHSHFKMSLSHSNSTLRSHPVKMQNAPYRGRSVYATWSSETLNPIYFLISCAYVTYRPPNKHKQLLKHLGHCTTPEPQRRCSSLDSYPVVRPRTRALPGRAHT